jgi:hypothetical protein
MTLTELVPSLEVCQRLKAAGFPQDTAFSWYDDHHVQSDSENRGYVAETEKPDMTRDHLLCAAPTAEEILKELPSCIERNGVSYYLEVQITPAWGWDVDWTDDDGTYLQPRGEEDCKQTIAEPAALAYLWWKEQE